MFKAIYVNCGLSGDEISIKYALSGIRVVSLNYGMWDSKLNTCLVTFLAEFAWLFEGQFVWKKSRLKY